MDTDVELHLHVDPDPEMSLSSQPEIESDLSYGPDPEMALASENDPEADVEVQPDPSMGVESEAVETDKAPSFPGPYSVTPDLDGEMLSVHGFKMSDDLEVKPIPVSEVSNPQGGRTLTIS